MATSVADALDHGWRATGVEPSTFAAAIGNRRWIPIFNGQLEELDPDWTEVDVITLWDVIEHLTSPTLLLEECRRRLRPGGALVLRTPDGRVFEQASTRSRSLLTQAYRVLVYPANPREHVWHYTPDTLRDLLAEHGFELAWLDDLRSPGERITVGRNSAVTLLKWLVSTATRSSDFPYEFVIAATKPTLS